MLVGVAEGESLADLLSLLCGNRIAFLLGSLYSERFLGKIHVLRHGRETVGRIGIA